MYFSRQERCHPASRHLLLDQLHTGKQDRCQFASNATNRMHKSQIAIDILAWMMLVEWDRQSNLQPSQSWVQRVWAKTLLALQMG